jgi:glyoxylase-like metal-dependent hydrolase (beta-lactamase superfamily II)
MEIRTNNRGANALSTKVYFSDEAGFEVASVIVMGKNNAALLDAQWTFSNAHRVIAEIAETGKRLETIYVTHAHPDHYFGLGVIAEAYPSARIVALPSVARTINRQFFGKLDHWESKIGPMNVCRKTADIEALNQNYFELEGQRIEIIPELMGDLKYNTVVWIPSISTLYGSDVLFNQAHPFTCEVTVEERAQWIRDIEMLEKMDAEVVIPGHQKPGMAFDASCYAFMKDYLTATEEALSATNDEGNFYYAMVQRFPQANLLGDNEMNAGVFKGGKNWNWRDDE